MTTGMLKGLTMEQAGVAVMQKAVEAMEKNGSDLGLWTEVGNGSVLVGISRRGKAASTLLIPKDEYCGLKLLELIGISTEPAPRAAVTPESLRPMLAKKRRR